MDSASGPDQVGSTGTARAWPKCVRLGSEPNEVMWGQQSVTQLHSNCPDEVWSSHATMSCMGLNPAMQLQPGQSLIQPCAVKVWQSPHCQISRSMGSSVGWMKWLHGPNVAPGLGLSIPDPKGKSKWGPLSQSICVMQVKVGICMQQHLCLCVCVYKYPFASHLHFGCVYSCIMFN